MNFWATFATTILSSGVITVVVTVMANRRKVAAETSKLGTEATKVIQEAASGVVKDLDADNSRLRQEIKDLRDGELAAALAKIKDLENANLALRGELGDLRHKLEVETSKRIKLGRRVTEQERREGELESQVKAWVDWADNGSSQRRPDARDHRGPPLP